MEIFARVSTSLCAPASRHPSSKRSFSRERHQKQRQRARTHATASTSETKKTNRTNEKTVILVRHGKTEMNEYLASNHWADEKFKDPLLYDTKLSKAGVAGAQLAQVYVEKLEPKPELICLLYTSDAADE